MSVYTLKLEQLIKTDSFGDLVVTIQYDAEGPKMVQVKGPKISPQLRHMLATVLGMVNFSLTKKIEPREIAEQMRLQPQDGIRTPFNDLLVVIATSLEHAPSDIKQLDMNKLMKIAPEMVKALLLKPMQPAGKSQTEETQGQSSEKSQQGSIQTSAPKTHEAPESEMDTNKRLFGGFRNQR